MKTLVPIIALAIAVGCTPASESMITGHQIKSLILQYHQYASEKGNAPESGDQLLTFSDPYSSLAGNKAASESMQSALKSGDYIVCWGYDVNHDFKRNATLVLVYHKDVSAKGGYVGFADGSARKVTAEQFKTLDLASNHVDSP